MYKRLPRFQDVMQVYAVAAFMLFSWSPILFFWYLPSWLYFMRPMDVIAVFSYIMVSTLIESLVFLLFLILLCFILPLNMLKDDFVPRGTLITILSIGWIMFYTSGSTFLMSGIGIGLTLAVTMALFFMIRMDRVRTFLVGLSDRLMIFLYIIIPVSASALFIVLIRNIL